MSAYNGSGTFVISGTGLPFVTATTISSTVVNQLDTDLAAGLSTAICKDGQTTVTANIPLAGFKLTGVGAATTTNDALTYGTGTNSSTLLVPTQQKLTSGTAATYTTPAGCRQLRIRMVGGGGGSGGTSTVSGATLGGTGGTTSFNSITAIGGGGSPAANPGANVGGGIGGTGGAGTAFRAPGNGGQSGQASSGNGAYGGSGGGSLLGGGQRGGVGAFAGTANSGGGASAANQGTIAGTLSAGGGGGGEYVEFIINTPAATYTYTIGAGGAAGTGDSAGAAGGTGIIIVDEIY